MFEKTKLFAESWNVAFRSRVPGTPLEELNTPFIVVKNTARYWAADPFLFDYQGRIFIFAELYDYILRRGVIGFCEIINGKYTRWQPIIVEDYHLSFPNIYQEDNEIFIMPESSAAGQVYRYRAIDFPFKWEKEKTIRENVRYVDTVLLEDRGNHYALTCCIDDRNNPELYWLDLDNPLNDCKVRTVNQEIRRPAGKVLHTEKMRCAQNCIEDYGKGLVFFSFDIENGQYSEKEVKRVFPEELKLSKRLYIDGMHTYNFSEHYEVIDIKTRRFSIVNLFFRIYTKIKKNG